MGKLTDDDLDIVKGHRQELSGKDSGALWNQEGEAEKTVDEFCKSL